MDGALELLRQQIAHCDESILSLREALERDAKAVGRTQECLELNRERRREYEAAFLKLGGKPGEFRWTDYIGEHCVVVQPLEDGESA